MLTLVKTLMLLKEIVPDDSLGYGKRVVKSLDNIDKRNTSKCDCNVSSALRM